jgi:hypothetical protein
MEKVVFEDYFNKSDGKPFIYNGKEIKMSDKINLPSSEVVLKISFISTDSNWKQGIVLQTKGEFDINGQKLPSKVVLWEDTAPTEVKMLVKSKDKVLFAYNVWDTGDGTMHYGHNGGAFYLEDKEEIRTYYCNDGYPDDDFNDLIFTIEIANKNV